MICFKNTHVGYKTSLFEINDVCLYAGKMYFLAGKNGTGKTTLLKSLVRSVPLHGGRIELNGKDLHQLEKRMLPQFVAFVESRFNGIPFLTLKDYISLGRSPHTNAFGRLKESDIQKTLEVMTLLNIGAGSTCIIVR